MTVRCTWVFNAATFYKAANRTEDATGGVVARTGSFTESWYSDLTFNTVPLFDLMTQWAILRAALLPSTSSIVGFKQTLIQAVPKTIPFKKFVPGGMQIQTDHPNMALVYKAHSRVGGAERDIVLRNVPDARVVQGEFRASGDWTAATTAFFDHLGTSWKMQAINQEVPAFEVVDVAGNGAMTTFTDAPFERGNLVQVLRTNIGNGRKKGGVYKVIDKTDAKHFLLGGWNLGSTTKGQVRAHSLNYEAVSIYDTDRDDPRVTTHKIGKAAFSFRGKNSRR